MTPDNAVERVMDLADDYFVDGIQARDALRTAVEALARDAAAAEAKRWTDAIGQQMPPDFKDWHENSVAELPEVAAWVIRDLRQRTALSALPQWQPIETAPRDGTHFIGSEIGHEWVAVCSIEEDDYSAMPVVARVLELAGATNYRSPTHWIPLPAPVSA